jgi:hypothetical protein
MDHEFHSIVERLAILEGRIAPTGTAITESKQKKPALFNNLKKDEVAEERSDDVLSQVKASLADYLKSAEENIKQDRELIAKKKQDLDLKKKELKDLELQQKKRKEEVKETDPADTLQEGPQLQPGDRVAVSGQNEYQGEFAEVVELSPSGKFVVISLERTGDQVSMHLSDVELTADESQLDDDDPEDYDDSDDSEFVEEDPNQTPAGGEASAGESNPTYATGSNNTYAEAAPSAPVKTVDFPIVEMGGSVLVEIHGNERDGFNIRRAGRDLPTRFDSLADAELALDMFKAHRAKQQADNESADYIEEK